MKTLDKKKWNKLVLKKNLNGAEALAAVKQDGNALQYVNEQTNEICLAAVKENGYALRYVIEQTNEIRLAAVKENGNALRYVNEKMFDTESTKTIKIGDKEISEETILIALKEYFK